MQTQGCISNLSAMTRYPPLAQHWFPGMSLPGQVLVAFFQQNWWVRSVIKLQDASCMVLTGTVPPGKSRILMNFVGLFL